MRAHEPVYLVGALSFLVALAGCAVPNVPRSVSADEIPAVIGALRYAPFSPSGAAFYKGRLYVSTNIGLLVINGARPEVLYKWIPKDDVVSGPWIDAANDALWVHHAHDNYFRRFDGTSWRLVTSPVYRRSGAISIVQGFGSPAAFWIVVGGRVWRYQTGEVPWTLEPRPPAPQYSETGAIAPLVTTMLYIVREGFEGTWHSRYAVYDRENNWARQDLSDKMQLPYESGSAVTMRDGTHVRARDGRLFRIRPKNVELLETPGRCEALAQTSTGKLLASFVDRGIFVLDNGRWKLKASYPYGPQEGTHWAFLAEADGQIAYATTPASKNEGGKTVYTRPAAIWILRGGKIERVI